MTHLSIPSTLYADSLTWTFSVSISIGIVLLIAILVERFLARRRNVTWSKKDTD